jgi:hypothetical protein
MKDKALRKIVKRIAQAVGVDYFEYSDGSISSSNVGHHRYYEIRLDGLSKRLASFEKELSKRDTIKRHIENKEPHVCKVCNQETKQK